MRAILHTITSQALKFTLPVASVIALLFFLPVTTDFFTPHKQLLLLVVALVSLLSWSIQMILRGEIRLNNSKALIPFILLPILYVISARIQSPNFTEALRGPVTTLIALSLIYLTTTSTLKSSQNISLTFNFMGVALSLAAILSLVTFAGLFASTGNFMANRAFNPVGGPLPLITVMLILLPAFFVNLIKSKDPLTRGISAFAILTGIPSLIVSLLLIRQGGPAPLVILPLSAGWSIAVEIFKAPLTALLGVGPSSFTNAYSQFRPLWLNEGAFWNARFGSSSNEILNLLTTVGIPATALILMGFIRPLVTQLKNKKGNYSQSLTVSLIVATVLLFIVPANLPYMAIAFVLIALTAIDQKSQDITDDLVISFFAARVVKAQDTEDLTKSTQKEATQILPWIAGGLSVALIVYMALLHYKPYISKYFFYQSLLAAAGNDGTKAYNLQIEAIKYNIYDPTFRITYSQTNLAIANAIASKEDITEADKNNVATLIQQSIREAKAGVTLEPKSPSAWQNLANIYRQLINLAQEADKWAIASYNRAIQLDPLNPQLRLDLGGVYYALGNYDQAISMFAQASTAKPNWANAHYNLAAAYKQKGEYQKAADTLNNVKRLLNSDSPDLAKVDAELAELQKIIDQNIKTPPTPTPTPTGTGSQLNTPPVVPSPNISPITLPETNGPDLNLNTPTPTPTPTTQP